MDLYCSTKALLQWATATSRLVADSLDFVNIALCDGSVRMVNKNMKLDTWRIIAGRDDGLVVPNDF